MGEETVFLYNIRIDPYERFNLVNVRPDIAMELINKLAGYQNSSLPILDPKNDLRLVTFFYSMISILSSW